MVFTVRMYGTKPHYGPRLVRKSSSREPQTSRSAPRDTRHGQIVAQLRYQRDGRGMHRMPALDFEVVLSGEVVLELDNGLVVVAKASDCMVQNGSRHSWHNYGQDLAVMAVFLSGAVFV